MPVRVKICGMLHEAKRLRDWWDGLGPIAAKHTPVSSRRLHLARRPQDASGFVAGRRDWTQLRLGYTMPQRNCTSALAVLMPSAACSGTWYPRLRASLVHLLCVFAAIQVSRQSNRLGRTGLGGGH